MAEHRLKYGIPFCAINKLPIFKDIFGYEPVRDISASALRFIVNNPRINVAICSVNSIEETEYAIKANTDQINPVETELLEKYNNLQGIDDGIPLFLSALQYDNLRMNYFASVHLSKVFKLKLPKKSLNDPDSREAIINHAKILTDIAAKKGYKKYLKGYKLSS